MGVVVWAAGLLLIAIGLGFRHHVRFVLVSFGALLIAHDLTAYLHQGIALGAIVLFSTDWTPK